MTCRHVPAEIIKKRGVSVKKRILSILLAALMLLSALPLGMVDTAYAAETSGVAAQSYYVAGGQCGDDLTWTLDSSGTLTISGTGPMYGYSLFKNPWCDSALRSSGISTRVKNVEISSGVTTLGAYAFSACDSMTGVSLPETLLAVGESCFQSSYGLHNISIPNSVRSIGDCAFSSCNGLTRVTLGSGLKGIGGQAFKECSSLSSIVIPEGVTAIEFSTFEDCSNLMEITIPRTVTSIGRWAFDGCYGLSKVTFTGTRAQWNAIDMGDDNDPLLSANITFAGSGPAAPTVTGGNDSQGRPTLKWNAVSGAAKYEVYRARSKDGDYIKYSTVTGTSYTNTSYLANGTTYYYKVRALGSDGTAGPDSTPVSVTYKAPFGAPLVTGSKDSQGRPALKWDKVTDAAKYEVYRARSKDGTYSLMSTQSATGYTNTSYLANGTTYYYKVRALKANGTASAYSSVVTITYGTVPTPAAPAMRSAKADSAGITVSWDTAANAVTYNVYRTADAGSSWTQVASSVKGSSYKDTTVKKGVKYGYKVRGVAADGKMLGPMSSTGVTAKVTAASTTPDYVKLTSAKRVTGGIQLTWESAADAKTYNVYRKVDGASGWTLLASSVSGTSYKDTSGRSGTTYAYTVRGVAADGKTLSRTYNTDGLRATMP